jgi:hypothetical protein
VAINIEPGVPRFTLRCAICLIYSEDKFTHNGRGLSLNLRRLAGTTVAGAKLFGSIFR